MNKRTLVCFLITIIYGVIPQQTSARQSPTSNVTVRLFLSDSKSRKFLLTNRPATGTPQDFKVIVRDSCISDSDTFSFSFHIDEPDWYSIEIEGRKGWQSFVAVPGAEISITGKADSLGKSIISGSVEDSLYIDLRAKINPLYDRMYSSSPDSFKTIYPKMIHQVKYDYIRQNPDSYIAAWYIVYADSYNLIDKTDSARRKELQSLYLALGEKARTYTPAKIAYYKLFVADQLLERGRTLPNVEMVDYTNTAFNLYEYLREHKRKYYFIDFWAVWCKPCIAQFPALTKLYNQYKDKGFGIIGFSFDTNRRNYENFMKKNSDSWPDVTELMGTESDIFRLFNLNALPSNFLIDEDFKIIDINLTTEKLEKFLQDALEPGQKAEPEL